MSQVTDFPSFLNNILLCVYVPLPSSLPTRLWMDTQAASVSWLLWVGLPPPDLLSS